MAKKKTYTPQLTTNQKIKLHIKLKNQCIIDCLRTENQCNHQWEKMKVGYRCENCDYYTGHDLRVNQLINKLNKQK